MPSFLVHRSSWFKGLKLKKIQIYKDKKWTKEFAESKLKSINFPGLKKKPRGTKIEKEKYNHNAYLSF